MSNVDRIRQVMIDVENRKQREFNNKLAKDRIQRDLDIAESRRKTAIEVAEIRRKGVEARLELDRNAEKRRVAKDEFDQKMSVAKDETTRLKIAQDYKIAADKLARDHAALQERIYQFDANLAEKQYEFDNPQEKTIRGPRGFIERTPPGGGFGEKERIYTGTPEHEKYLKEQADKQAADTAAAAQAEVVKRENERLGILGRLKRWTSGAPTPPPMTNLPPASPMLPNTNGMVPPPMGLPATETGTNTIGIPLIIPAQEGEWDLEGGMRAPPMSATTNAIPSAVAPQLVVPPLPPQQALPPSTDFIIPDPGAVMVPTATNAPAATVRRMRVKGPGGKSGTVPEGSALPEGWSFE